MHENIIDTGVYISYKFIGLNETLFNAVLWILTFGKSSGIKYIVYCIIYTCLIKRCWVQSIFHERCDTMEFWEDSNDKLATQFHISSCTDIQDIVIPIAYAFHTTTFFWLGVCTNPGLWKYSYIRCEPITNKKGAIQRTWLLTSRGWFYNNCTTAAAHGLDPGLIS